MYFMRGEWDAMRGNVDSLGWYQRATRMAYDDATLHYNVALAFRRSGWQLAAEEMFDRGRRASWTRLALQPPWAFVRSYLLRGGWLDGVPGLIVAVLHAQYVFMKYAKLRERATVGAPR